MAKGDLVVAGELLEGVRRVVEDRSVSEWQRWRYSMHLFVGLGELFLTRGELDKAREFVNRCVDQATRTASRKYIVRGWRLRGELAMAQRRWDDAGAALREALDGAVMLGNPSELWKTHEAFGQLRDAEGKRDDARAAYSAAAEMSIRCVRASARLRCGRRWSARPSLSVWPTWPAHGSEGFDVIGVGVRRQDGRPDDANSDSLE